MVEAGLMYSICTPNSSSNLNPCSRRLLNRPAIPRRDRWRRRRTAAFHRRPRGSRRTSLPPSRRQYPPAGTRRLPPIHRRVAGSLLAIRLKNHRARVPRCTVYPRLRLMDSAAGGDTTDSDTSVDTRNTELSKFIRKFHYGRI